MQVQQQKQAHYNNDNTVLGDPNNGEKWPRNLSAKYGADVFEDDLQRTQS